MLSKNKRCLSASTITLECLAIQKSSTTAAPRSTSQIPEGQVARGLKPLRLTWLFLRRPFLQFLRTGCPVGCVPGCTLPRCQNSHLQMQKNSNEMGRKSDERSCHRDFVGNLAQQASEGTTRDDAALHAGGTCPVTRFIQVWVGQSPPSPLRIPF